MTVLGIVLTGLTGLFASAWKAEMDMNYRFRAQQEARLALDRLRREVHCASSVSPSSPTSALTLTFGTSCVAGTSVSWCTLEVSSGRYALYRKPGTSCDSAGLRVADYLTGGTVFGYLAPTSASRAKLTVDLPVDVRSSDSVGPYRLTQSIVLRNSTWAS